MKKLIILFLISCFFVTIASAEELTEDRLMATGFCGDAVTWNIYESGKCVIEGNGNIYDSGSCYDIRCDICGESGWHWSLWSGHYVPEYTSDEYIDRDVPTDFSHVIKTIEFKGNIDYIGYGAFSNLAALEEVVLPSNITVIESSLFSGCTSLKSISVPENVTTIEYSAFAYCSSLEDVELPNGIKYLNGTFNYCTSLSEIVLPDSLVSISGAFSGCSNLETVKMPSNLETIEDRTFSDCVMLKSIDIPSSVTTIGYGAFSGCTSLENVIIPDGITSVEGSTFSDCTSLKEVIFPRNLENIGECAFYNCSSLTNINLPDTVTTISYSAFQNVPLFNPQSITEDYYVSDWLVQIFKTDRTDYEISCDAKIMPGAFSDSGITTVCFENGVTDIPPYFFYENEELKTVKIPVSVAKIGSYAFAECTSLETVEFLEDDEIQNETGELVKNESKLEEIEDYAFYNCSRLSDISFNESIKVIGNEAFANCACLKILCIPKSMRNIGNRAFANCSGLETVLIIPVVDGLLAENELSAENAFGDEYRDEICQIDTLYLGGSNYDYDYLHTLGIQTNKKYYLYGCEYDINNKVLTGSEGAVRACVDNDEAFSKNVHTIKIKEGTTVIGGYQYEHDFDYAYFKNLRHFIMPDSLERIDEYGLSFLSEIYITIPKNVSYIHPLCGWSSDLLGIYVDAENEYFMANGKEVYSKDGTVLYRTLSTGEVYIVPENVTVINDFAINYHNQIIIHKNVMSIGYDVLYYNDDVYYEGTAEEWNSIKLEDDYYQVHFNYGQKMTKTKCDKVYSGNYQNPFYKLTISFPDIEIKSGMKVFARGTNKNGERTIVEKTLSSTDTFAELNLPYDTTHVKVLLWENLTTLKPVAKAEEICIVQ